MPVADEKGDCVEPVPYGFRSFDRQWIIPDSRLINQPNPELWRVRSERQVHLTALSRTSPSSGSAITFTESLPDLDHYKGSFGGRVFPLWGDPEAKTHKLRPKLLSFLAEKYGRAVTAEDVVAYIAAVVANPAYTKRFQEDLSTPGLRIPLTGDGKLFGEAALLGRRIIWLHTFGERMADEGQGRPAGPPRIAQSQRPHIPAAGAIPGDPDNMPGSISYDTRKKRLLLGQGYIENVEPGTWLYEPDGE